MSFWELSIRFRSCLCILALPFIISGCAATGGVAVAPYWHLRGDNAKSAHRYQDAIDNYSKAIEALPTFAPSWEGRANAKMNLQQFSAAIGDYDQALKLEPNNAEYLYNRGTCYVFLKNGVAAEPDLKRATEIDPKDPEKWHNYAISLAMQNRKDEAQVAEAKARELFLQRH